MHFRIVPTCSIMHRHFHAEHIESYNRAVETLCRNCGYRPPADVEICPACESARILRHKELQRLLLRKRVGSGFVITPAHLSSPLS